MNPDDLYTHNHEFVSPKRNGATESAPAIVVQTRVGKSNFNGQSKEFALYWCPHDSSTIYKRDKPDMISISQWNTEFKKNNYGDLDLVRTVSPKRIYTSFDEPSMGSYAERSMYVRDGTIMALRASAKTTVFGARSVPHSYLCLRANQYAPLLHISLNIGDNHSAQAISDFHIRGRFDVIDLKEAHLDGFIPKLEIKGFFGTELFTRSGATIQELDKGIPQPKKVVSKTLDDSGKEVEVVTRRNSLRLNFTDSDF